MPSRALTAVAVERIKPPAAGQTDYFDRGFPGLVLRVSHGGSKTWTFIYRLNGRQHRMTLGRYPVLSLRDAREAQKRVTVGESPTLPPRADAFLAILTEWLRRDQADNRSAAEVKRAIERDVVPVWRDRRIDTLTRRDVIEVIDAVADRGSLIMARRLHAYLHRLFKWSVGRGILQVNPMADLPAPTTTSPTPLAALLAPPAAAACSILSSGTTIVPGVVAHHQATNCFGSSGADEQRPTMSSTLLSENCTLHPCDTRCPPAYIERAQAIRVRKASANKRRYEARAAPDWPLRCDTTCGPTPSAPCAV
jgi:hypothetical protein